MLHTTDYLTKYGFTLPEAYLKIDNVSLRADGYISFDYIIIASENTPTEQALKKQSVTISYQKAKDFEYTNNTELVSQIETWLVDATEPKDLGSGIEEVKILDGDWVIL